jgi:dTDP-4-dehydrorhamnose reductase
MWIEDLVTATCALLEKHVTGTVHVCGDEAMSRYEMACSLARSMGLGAEAITPIRLDDLGLSPIRPKQTSMRNQLLRSHSYMLLINPEIAIRKIASNFSI